MSVLKAFQSQIADYSVMLLDAGDTDEREWLARCIVQDKDLAAGLIMLLAEALVPLLDVPDELQ